MVEKNFKLNAENRIAAYFKCLYILMNGLEKLVDLVLIMPFEYFHTFYNAYISQF